MVVPKGLLTFLGYLGNAEFTPEILKKFAFVFVTASDAMDFFIVVYRFCRVPEIKSYILS